MNKVYQTKFGKESNAIAACFASIAEIPLRNLPDFKESLEHGADKSPAWENMLQVLLDKHKGKEEHAIIITTEPDAPTPDNVHPYHLILCKGPRGVEHCVVGIYGKQFHDPHPDGGYIEPVKFMYFPNIFNTWENNDDTGTA